MTKLISKGGKGSGNWGHAGRPGKVGGSAPRGGGNQQGELPDGKNALDAVYGMKKLALRKQLGDSLAAKPPGWDDDTPSIYDEGFLDRHVEAVSEGGMRDEAVAKLSKMTGLSENGIDEMLETWKYGSNGDKNRDMIQMAVVSVFNDSLGTNLSEWQKGDMAKRAKNDDGAELTLWKHEPGVETVREKFAATKKLVAAMYELTQKRFHDRNVRHVTLYRGYITNATPESTLQKGDDVVIDENALSSWSLDPSIAWKFVDERHKRNRKSTGYAVSASFPAERVLSIDLTGFAGTLKELEATVIGSSEDDTAHVEYVRHPRLSILDSL